ncbi:DoxX family protein [Rhizobium sp. 1399]|uniref:DoxX family protein n=1 Tax=Rhizobium sp. 1399 TaxID=2817758 RepID=UPI00286C95FE|nr:DoxX family protein [Rhizobium sp. 1399]
MSIWIGRILSAAVVVLLLADAATNLFAPDFIRAEMEATGFPVNLAPALGVIIAICAILYAVPKNSLPWCDTGDRFSRRCYLHALPPG